MAFFAQTATGEITRTLHRILVGSGAGTFLLQRFMHFALQLWQLIIGRSAVTPAFSRRPHSVTPPRILLISAATAAILVVAGMAPSDHAQIRISVSVAGSIPATETDLQVTSTQRRKALAKDQIFHGLTHCGHSKSRGFAKRFLRPQKLRHVGSPL